MTARTQPRFAIGIPARNEAQLIGRTIHSILSAADALEDPTAVGLVIACDSCDDATGDVARSLAERDERVEVIDGTWCSAGASRAAAIRHALEATPDGTELTDIWVATTDADTVVPANWLCLHAAHWFQGDDAVAGVVDLLEEDAEVRTIFGRHYVLGRDSHRHVHGANLGIRADAYVQVGGFPAIDLAEDHALWHALRQAGFSCRSSVSLRVATSARLTGRAVGGFADTLRNLMDDAVSASNPAATA